MAVMVEGIADRWPRGRALALVAGVALLVLPSLPIISPVDQIWIAGVYDDGDHDDVVLAVTSSLTTLDPVPLGQIAPGWIPAPLALSPEPPARAALALSALQTRAPPAR
jgi:hypothetical protein